MLAIQSISKTYDNGVQALSNVSLQIPKGMYGLLGPNGAGKSTLMRTIATLQEPDAGSIEFDGVDVQQDKDKIRQILGYLPQDFGVYPRISAMDMLDHMAVLKGIAHKKQRHELVKALLEQTNLYADRKKNLSSFSGGMRQRFGIAQALIGDPQLIIVDEPTAGLDPAERNRFHNLLSEIGENVVVILSTHIVEDVSDLCRQMAIMNDGEVLLQGEPALLIEAMQGRIWKRVIDKAELPDYKNQFQIISTRLFSGKTVVHALSDERPDAGFEPVTTGLEDVYFSTLLKTQKAA